MWCDLLNTLILKTFSTPDELVDASSLHHQSNASLTPCPWALFQPPPPQPSYSPTYHYPPYPYPPPPVGGSSDGNAPPPYPYPHLHHMDTHHIHICSTANMNDEELASHQEALRRIKNDLYFSTRNAAVVQDEEDE
jgi:hypothetical protein